MKLEASSVFGTNRPVLRVMDSEQNEAGTFFYQTEVFVALEDAEELADFIKRAAIEARGYYMGAGI